MKKILYMFFVAALMLSATTVHASNEVYYMNKLNIEMTEQQYNNLLNAGFTEKQIEYMNQEAFTALKDTEATVVAQKIQHVKTTTIMRNGIQFHTSKILTDEEWMEEVNAKKEQPYSQRYVPGSYYNGVSYDDYKTIIAIIINVDDETMIYKLDAYWDTMPNQKYYDLMGIGVEAPKVNIESGIYFSEIWRDSSDVEHYNSVCYPKTESTGGTVLYPLPSSSLESLESSMYFFIGKKSGVGTITSLTAAGDYAHATASVTNNVINYASTNVAIGLVISSPYTNSYDEMFEAFASFVGTW